jgi:hypothetical protein
VKRKELRPRLVARLEAERLVGLAHGIALQQLVDPAPRAAARAERVLRSAVRALA